MEMYRNLAMDQKNSIDHQRNVQMDRWLNENISSNLLYLNNSEFVRRILRSFREYSKDIFVVDVINFQWITTEDPIHYYFLIGLIPTFCIVFYANVFVGQATLTDIPEGYEPRHYEYYKHPIRRFLARYCVQSFDERYEISLHAIYVNCMRDRLRALERKVQRLEHARGDAKGWFYRPDVDHLPELEHKKAGERSDGFSAITMSFY
nr:EOG090X0FIE [Ilyocryptus agilis]